jgi:translation elongation factor EF-1alpha
MRHSFLRSRLFFDDLLSLSLASFVPVSGMSGENLTRPVGSLAPWYKGNTLKAQIGMG